MQLRVFLARLSQFRLLQQEKEKKLSDCLRQLDQALSKVVSKGGIPVTHVNAAVGRAATEECYIFRPNVCPAQAKGKKGESTKVLRAPSRGPSSFSS